MYSSISLIFDLCSIYDKLTVNLSLTWPDGRVVQQETKKKSKKVEEEDGEAGGDKEEQEEEEEEEKVIFVHYEQRKVMLSQLHPIQNGVPDPKTDPPSELRQVRDRGTGSFFTSCLLNFIAYVPWMKVGKPRWCHVKDVRIIFFFELCS